MEQCNTGLPEFKIANLFEDIDTLKLAQEAAIKILSKDSKLEKPENMSEIVKQVSIELGKPMRVVLVDNNEEVVAKTDSYSDIAKSLDMPINIIE